MYYKNAISVNIEKINILIHELDNYRNINGVFFDHVEKVRIRTQIYQKIQELIINIELLSRDIKGNVEIHQQYLKDKYCDDYSMGYWEYLFILQLKELDTD